MSLIPLQRSETSTTPSLRSWINFRVFTVGQAGRGQCKTNKPKGLKVAKEVLMSIGSMVDRLDD